MTWPVDFPDSTGDPVCGYCGRAFPVSSMARAHERKHEEGDDADL